MITPEKQKGGKRMLLGEIQGRGEIKDIKQVMNYVYQLEEQVRYILGHLGAENLSPGAVGEEQLSVNVKKDISDSAEMAEQNQRTLRNTKGDVATLQETASGLQTEVSNAQGSISTLQQTATSLGTRLTTAEGNISTVTQTASGLTTRVGNAEGSISTLQQTASSLGTRLTTAEGNISTVTQTASGLSTRVGTAEGKVTTLEQKADAIGMTAGGIDMDQATGTIKSSKMELTADGVEIKTGGTFTVASNNFNIGADGSVEMNGKITAESGKIGGFNIKKRTLGDTSQGFFLMMAQNQGDRGIYLESSTTPNRFALEAVGSGVSVERLNVWGEINVRGDEGFVDVKDKVLHAAPVRKMGTVASGQYLTFNMGNGYMGVMLTIGPDSNMNGMYLVSKASGNYTISAVKSASGVSAGQDSAGKLIVRNTAGSGSLAVVFMDIEGSAALDA
jgi:hypothetical protein